MIENDDEYNVLENGIKKLNLLEMLDNGEIISKCKLKPNTQVIVNNNYGLLSF
jgi:hypothetical protein